MPTKQWLLDHGYDPHLYGAWLNMRNRCNNPNGKDFDRYGGRGIKVCSRWNIFANFELDMGPHPGPGWTLERKRNNESYRCSNCKWATRRDQARNRGAYLKLSLDIAEKIRNAYKPGLTRQVDIAKQFGVSQVDVSQITRNVRWVA